MNVFFKSDEIEVGIRKSDNSPYVKLYTGEQHQDDIAELYKSVGKQIIWNVQMEADVAE